MLAGGAEQHLEPAEDPPEDRETSGDFGRLRETSGDFGRFRVFLRDLDVFHWLM